MTAVRWVDGAAALHPRASAPHAAGAKLPLAAQGAVSRILGRDDRAYHAMRHGGGFMVRNREQRLRAWFGSRGVVIRSGRAWLTLSLRAYGYGERSHYVGAVAPQAQANRVAYRHRELVEWYANGPLGIEQGFTLARHPSGRDGGPFTLWLALSGNVQAGQAAGGVSFTRPGLSLAYRALTATDARGKILPARTELRDGAVLLRIDDRTASYPVRIDPLIQQAKLEASDGAAGDQLGLSVAISGNTVIAGAPASNSNRGAAYVFVQPAQGWATETQAAKLTASDGAPNDGLGSDVAISGNTVVAGAPGATVKGSANRGTAYVFVQSGTSWTQQAKLTASDGAAGDYLGSSVGISGNTVIAGAPASNAIRGAAYVFVQPARGWATETQAAKLTASDGAPNDGLGSDVAVDGNTVVAGAPGSNGTRGAAYVFVANGASWTQQAKLTASDRASGDVLGSAVAISGNTIIAGAARATVNGQSVRGAMYKFVQPAGGWASGIEVAKLIASDGIAGDGLGSSVAISGSTVVGGSPYNDAGLGAGYVFAPLVSGGTQPDPCQDLVDVLDNLDPADFASPADYKRAVAGEKAQLLACERAHGERPHY